MAGLFAADGSINVSVVPGTTYTGIYAADGSYNVIAAPGNSYVGTYHPCGAYWITDVLVATTPVGWYAADGSRNVSTSSYIPGTTKVTVVSGSLANVLDSLLLVDGVSHLLLVS